MYHIISHSFVVSRQAVNPAYYDSPVGELGRVGASFSLSLPRLFRSRFTNKSGTDPTHNIIDTPGSQQRRDLLGWPGLDGRFRHTGPGQLFLVTTHT